MFTVLDNFGLPKNKNRSGIEKKIQTEIIIF